MRSDQPGYGFTLVDPMFFETLDRYVPRDDYRAPVREMLGEGWTVLPKGFWTHCIPDDASFLRQGWKIHLSAGPSAALDLLGRVVPLLRDGRVPFKFASDPAMHAMSLSKNWPREGAGKFVTVYPASDAQFSALAAELDARTRDLRGPYILSDRAYGDSRTVFYRYGEHLGAREMTAQGFSRHVLEAPTGATTEDVRTPYYQLPSWMADPFGRKPVENVAASGRQVLLGGRYRVVEALKYNSSGGIYTAIDERTDRPVVVREARPGMGEWAPGRDAISLLQKEARILERISPLGLCPGYVDLFRQWEHWFLVQERIEGQTLWIHAITFYWGRRRRLPPRECFRRLRRTCLAVMEGMQAFHDHGVLLRDMTRTNVLIRPDGRPIFIDFEMAYETGRDDPPVHGFTPGFASADQRAHRAPSAADDHYALGALLLDTVTFMASGLPLNRAGILDAFRRTRRDLELPKAVEEVVEGLLEERAEDRWTPARVRRALRSVRLDQVPARRGTASPAEVGGAFGVLPRSAPDPALRDEVAATVPEVARFIEAAATPERRDRLFPASPEVFLTNPVSLQFGAAGVLAFLREARGSADPAHVEWMLERMGERPVPPGMYVGRAGVALVLADAGRREEALRLAEGLADDPLLENVYGLYAGRAGVGLALLSLSRTLERPALAERAVEIGDRLLGAARRSGSAAYWHHERRRVPLGLGHGQSGVALFLLYLSAATGDGRYLGAARKGLAFDLRHVLRASGEALWTPTTHAGAGEPKSPHVEYGAAGIGSVAVRMYHATGDEQYLRWAWDCARAVSERFTNKTWYGFGLSGYGQLLLDLHRFLGDANSLNTAFYLAEAILPHRIPTRGGIAFAGGELARVSCDFAMGSAGIGWFLLRLTDPSRRSHPFCPDELLAGAAPAAAAGAVEAEPGPARRLGRRRELAIA